jgi:MFS family permease
VYVAEAWPEDRRSRGAGYMHTGYYFGFFLAAANYAIGASYGWRAMFLVGGVPALLVGCIRYGVAEPERWSKKRTQGSLLAPLRAIFSREYRGRTALNSIYLFISIVGLWAGSVYVPASVTQLAVAAGRSATQAAKLASWGGMLLAVGTILGCLAASLLAERFGRRAALAIYFALMAASIAIGFGYVFYLREHALQWFMACLFALGVGGANFAVYTLWLPEQYRTSCRASAFAFATSVGRFAAAGVTFLVGAGVERFHSIGVPIALTSFAFAAGLALVPFGIETKGQPLP